MFPMIPIYYPNHIGKWHPHLFLFPLYSQWVPKGISTFSRVPNTHHITIHLDPICGGKFIPPSYTKVVWKRSNFMCIQILGGVHNVVFFFFNEPIKLFHYRNCLKVATIKLFHDFQRLHLKRRHFEHKCYNKHSSQNIESFGRNLWPFT
jgi:hypothetical protein